MQRSLLHDMAEHAAAEGGGGAPMRHGTLEGHVLPGCLFLVWGCWWAAAFVRSWALAAAHGGRPGSGAAFYAPPWFPAAWLLPASVGWPALVSALERAEPFVKAVLPFVGLADELLPWSPLFQGTVLLHAPIHGLQHALMYLGIMLSGCVDLAVARHPELPAGLPPLFLSTAFGSQAFILAFHLTGPALDIRLHILLALLTSAVALSIAASAAAPASAAACYAKVVALLSLGSFWVQTGDLMYRRPAFDTPEGVAIAPVLMVLHVFGWAAVLLGAAVVAAPRVGGGGGGGGGDAAAAAAAAAMGKKGLGDSEERDEEGGRGGGVGGQALPLLSGLSFPVTRKSAGEEA